VFPDNFKGKNDTTRDSIILQKIKDTERLVDSGKAVQGKGNLGQGPDRSVKQER
jgi:hypothetical protein